MYFLSSPGELLDIPRKIQKPRDTIQLSLASGLTTLKRFSPSLRNEWCRLTWVLFNWLLRRSQLKEALYILLKQTAKINIHWQLVPEFFTHFFSGEKPFFSINLPAVIFFSFLLHGSRNDANVPSRRQSADACPAVLFTFSGARNYQEIYRKSLLSP